MNINNDSFIITNNNIEYEVFFSDHPELKEINGISSTLGDDIIDDNQNQLDTKGVLFYRKNEQEIIALSRACTHQGCPIEPFEPV